MLPLRLEKSPNCPAHLNPNCANLAFPQNWRMVYLLLTGVKIMPSFLIKGIIELLEDFVVCKEGNKISSEQSRILKYFDHRLTEFRLN
jgi:hypothetical protein